MFYNGGNADSESDFFSGWNYIVISNDTTDNCHHTLFYENEDNHRGALICEKEEYIELGLKISKYIDHYIESDIEDLPYSELYFVFFLNKNQNDMIEEGELYKIKVIFKK